MAPDGKPRYSIIIRTKNEEGYLVETLEAVFGQTLIGDAEVIVVDSGSTDRTLELARQFHVRLLEIESADFSYGGSLNTGIGAASGEFAIILSAHAVPASPQWLERMLEPFGDGSVGGVFGRQIPHLDCNPLERLAIEKWFRPSGERPRMLFSNANSVVRRSVWERCHFDETVPGGEDSLWAEEISKLGYCIQYSPNGAVKYARNENLPQIYRRSARERYVLSSVMGHPSDRRMHRRVLAPAWSGTKDGLAILALLGWKGLPWAVRSIPRALAIELGMARGELAAKSGESILMMSRR